MICNICGKEGTRIRRVSRTYGKGADLLIIENIPVVSCPHCGESYLTAETLREIERIKVHRESLVVERPVEVASFLDGMPGDFNSWVSAYKEETQT
ncbi:MAG: type II toxin-antitoxin system MqsA family antitoxin [Chloroflexia bacterium]